MAAADEIVVGTISGEAALNDDDDDDVEEAEISPQRQSNKNSVAITLVVLLVTVVVSRGCRVKKTKRRGGLSRVHQRNNRDRSHHNRHYTYLSRSVDTVD